MSQQHRLRRFCRGCDRPREEGELYSLTGLCPTCSEVLPVVNNRELAAHSGASFERWRRRTLAAFGVSDEDLEVLRLWRESGLSESD